MKTMTLASAIGACALLAVLPVSGQSPAAPLGTGPASPKTPWGEPDLQGTWTSEAELSVPFERPREYGERRELTEQEFTARLAQTQRQLESDNAEFDVATADTRNVGAVGSATSPPAGKSEAPSPTATPASSARLPPAPSRATASSAIPPACRAPTAPRA